MRIAVAACLAAVTLAGPAFAQNIERPAVVELYTSQGCSSCPPADALLARLAERPDVIALALHVDYWDYMGWKDTFGDPDHTRRQKAYARAAGQPTIYTPQMVVNGSDRLVGADAAALEELLAPAGGAAGPVLRLTRTGTRLSVRAEASAPLPAGSFVQLVRFLPRAVVAIERGENAGRVIGYVNIVTDWQRVGEWDGSAPLSLDLEASGDAPAVVLIQAPGPGPILAAAAVR